MSDILCRVCGEPWDAYGVHHGDMMAWEARLFKAGAGCPSCKGDAPDLDPSEREELRLASAQSMADGWDDPDSFPLVLDIFTEAVTGKQAKQPTWKEPTRKALWACEWCKVECVKALRFSLSEDNPPDMRYEWRGGERVHYHYGTAYSYSTLRDAEEPTEKPAFEVAGKPYCPGCVKLCDGLGCTTPIFQHENMSDDCYDAGASFTLDGEYHDTYCLSCFERLTAEREAEERSQAVRDIARDAWNKRFAGWSNDDVRAMIAEQRRKAGL